MNSIDQIPLCQSGRSLRLLKKEKGDEDKWRLPVKTRTTMLKMQTDESDGQKDRCAASFYQYSVSISRSILLFSRKECEEWKFIKQKERNPMRKILCPKKETQSNGRVGEHPR